jgi:hypothetical protein
MSLLKCSLYLCPSPVEKAVTETFRMLPYSFSGKAGSGFLEPILQSHNSPLTHSQSQDCWSEPQSHLNLGICIMWGWCLDTLQAVPCKEEHWTRMIWDIHLCLLIDPRQVIFCPWTSGFSPGRKKISSQSVRFFPSIKVLWFQFLQFIQVRIKKKSSAYLRL